jgi:16S rRNA (uracil1498-N3)-methyltransferase
MATAGAGRGVGPERAYAPEIPPEGEVALPPEEARHLVRVRRLAPGDALVLFDGRGRSAVATLVRVGRGVAIARVDGPWPDREPARPVRLAVSLPEPPRADRLVSVLAEMGVAELVPLVAARTHPRRAAMVAERADRFHRLAVEAAKVNGRARLLAVAPARTLADALREPCVLLDPDPAARPLLEALADRETLPLLLVGPEGGFTDDEIALARAAGAEVSRLGIAVLRVENAALAAAAVALCA